MVKKPVRTIKSGQGRILFVEDEKNLVDIYHDYFAAYGYEISSTKDIEEALAATEAGRPDLVLLDIIIPKEKKGVVDLISEQGYDYLAAVKKNSLTKDIPVVVFTNLDSDQDRKKCESLGAAAYIFKRDCSPKEVLAAVEKIIGARRPISC
ncbi:MAG: response regulator [bacterium]|nr:response regulator [bacterium]